MIRPEQTHPHLVGSDPPPRTGMARLGSIGARWLAHGLGRPIERFGAALRRLAADDGGRPHFEADRERRRFALAVKSMPIGLCLFDADHRLVICNRRYAEMYGLPDSLIRPGTHWHEIIRFWIRIENYDAEQAEAFFERLDRASYQNHVSTETIHLPGNRAYNLLHQPLEGGGWVATHEDVSERHQAEREIARLGEEAETERRRLEAALTNMPIGLTMFDADKRLITANPSFRRLYDLPDHLVRPGTPFRDILEHRITTGRYPGGDPTTWIADLVDVVDRHERLRDVLTFRNGSTMRIVHQPTPEGGWVTIHEDVTERYGAQLEIARLGEEAEVERQRLEAALSNMPIGLTMFDGEKRLITTNRRYAELYGLPDDLLKPGTPFRDLMDFRIRDGSFPADGAEEWVQELFGVVERGESTRDLTELKNGRFVSIIHEPMVGGGWIATHEDVTERHLADREINRLADEAERERRRLDTAMSNMPIGVCLFDGDKRLIAANSHYAEMYRLAADRLVPGMTVQEVLALHVEAGNNGESDPDEWAAEALRIADLSSDWRGIKPTASGRTHSILIKPLNGGGWVSTHEDVTERFEAQQEILRLGEEAEIERQRLNAAVNNMPIGLVMFDAEQRLIVANGRYAEMYRMPRRLTAPGTPLEAILAHRTSAGEFGGPDAAAYDRFVRKMVDQREPASDILRFRDGRIFSLVFQPMKDGGWVTTHEDVTDRQKAQAQIAHMAHHDYLTDLPNRVLFRERIEQALARDGAGKGAAVLCLDLDHFKAVNDTLGHPVGDKLLQAAARRLSALVRDDLTVARLGGDEFALLQIGADQPKAARKLAQQIIEDLSAPYKLDGHQVVTGVSIGIAVAPDDGDTADKLLKNGDMALYRAKGDGRGSSASSNRKWMRGCRHAGRLRSTSAAPPNSTSSSSTTSRNSTLAPGASPDSRRFCAGAIQIEVSSRRRNSFRSLKKPV